MPWKMRARGTSKQGAWSHGGPVISEELVRLDGFILRFALGLCINTTIAFPSHEFVLVFCASRLPDCRLWTSALLLPSRSIQSTLAARVAKRRHRRYVFAQSFDVAIARTHTMFVKSDLVSILYALHCSHARHVPRYRQDRLSRCSLSLYSCVVDTPCWVSRLPTLPCGRLRGARQ